MARLKLVKNTEAMVKKAMVVRAMVKKAMVVRAMGMDMPIRTIPMNPKMKKNLILHRQRQF